MAAITGTATDHGDLWDTLITFLTDDGDLVGAGQAWQIVWEHDDGQQAGVVLQGPGLADQDDVLIGLRMVERASDDEYEIQMVGMTGIIPSAPEITDHVNVTPYIVRTFVDNAPMDYWIVANGRRFIAVVKISTVFEAMYGGLILPYAMPDQYSYPLFVGGSAGVTDREGLTSWRSTSDYHRHFVHSYYDTPTQYHHGSAFLLSPQGDWLTCGALGNDANVAIAPRYFFGGFGITAAAAGLNFGYGDIRQRQCAGFGGELLLTPFTLLQASPSDQTYGVLDGAHHVTGFANSSENIITVDGVDHLTVQDCFRTGVGDYWALALE